MQEFDSDQGAAAAPSPEVLAGRIEELLRDIHDRRLPLVSASAERLQTAVFLWDNAPLAQEVSSLHSAGRELQVRRARQSWFSRLLGRHRAPVARFVAAHERIVGSAARLKASADDLAPRLAAHRAGAKALLRELETECKHIEQLVDEGVTWLHDMCEQLAHLRIDEHPKLVSLVEAAQGYTTNFKWLQSVLAVAHDVGVRGNGVLDRRNALLQQVRSDAEGFGKAWAPAVGAVAAALKAERHPGPLAEAAQAHEDFMRRLEAASDACTALLEEEHRMAQQVAQLRSDLRTPA